MRYDKTKLREAALKRIEELEADQKDVVGLSKHHAALEEFRKKEIEVATDWIKQIKAWNIKRDSVPIMKHAPYPQRLVKNHADKIKRLQEQIKQIDMCADSVIDIKPSSHYDLFYDLFN